MRPDRMMCYSVVGEILKFKFANHHLVSPSSGSFGLELNAAISRRWEHAQPAYGFARTPPSAIVHGIPKFI
jgi:hypothetical protein